MCGVTLLARRFAVGFQDCINEPNQRRDYRPLARGLLALGWLGIRQRLAHHPPVNSQPARHPQHRPLPKIVLPPYLLE